MLLLLAVALLQFVPTTGQAPYRAPQVAAAKNQVALAYGSGKAIYVAVSADQGKTFANPVQVDEVGVLPLGRHRGPRVVYSRDTIVVTAVVGSTEGQYGVATDGNLMAWRSSDGGKTWSKGVRVNDVPAAAREGLHALTSDGRENLFATWLDLRKEGTQLYGAFSKDSGKTWSRNVLVYQSPDGSICQCCHPSAAYASDGSLDVMWRNSLGGSRDFYVVHSADGKTFGKPVKLGEGTWKINMCPMDGGGVAHDGNRTVTAWRREKDVYLAEPGKLETKLGDGKDVALAAGDGHVYAAWVAQGHLQLWKDGKLVTLAGEGSLPAIAVLPGGAAVVAWEHNGGVSVQRFD
jgi:hypothetical protein